jgi:hypothetical protein
MIKNYTSMSLWIYPCPVCKGRHQYDYEKLIEGEWQLFECPDKNSIYKANRMDGEDVFSCLQNEDRAYMEAGKDILKNSRTSLREFSTFMTTLSSGAIATYFLLVAFVIPKDISLNSEQSIVSAIPAFLFLICIGFFISSIFPSTGKMNLNSITSIAVTHQTTIRERYFCIICGIAIFAAAIASVITITVSLRFFAT